MNVYNDTYLPDILHDIAQGLLIPTMVCIIALILIMLFFVGQIVAEYFTERRHFKQNKAAIVNDLNDAPYDGVTRVILDSKLLVYQKSALVTVAKNMGLPEESLFSLAQMAIADAGKRLRRRLAWTDTVSKLGPLLGLMGTLIPLGPGLMDLGKGDVSALSNSLLLAFDATVCGLVCAITALVISKIRSGWYSEYMATLESVMSCVVDKADQAREAGVQLPANYTGDPVREFDLRRRAGKQGGDAASPDAPGGQVRQPGAGGTGSDASGQGGE